MRYLLTIWIIIVLIGLLFISLIYLEEYGTNGVILASVSAFVLYRIFKLIFKSDASDWSDDEDENRASRKDSMQDPLELIIFGDLTGKFEPGAWDDEDDW